MKSKYKVRKMQKYGPGSYYVNVPRKWKDKVEKKHGAIIGFRIDVSRELVLRYIAVFHGESLKERSSQEILKESVETLREATSSAVHVMTPRELKTLREEQEKAQHYLF